MRRERTSRTAVSMLAASAAILLGMAGRAAAQKIGPEFQVNTSTTAAQIANHIRFSDARNVMVDKTGAFVVTWVDYATATAAIKLQRFDASGNRIGSEFQADT